MRADVATSNVRDLLERVTGARPEHDEDGDLPVIFGGAQFYVRVVGSDDAWIQVFSVALADVDSSPGMLAELNAINSERRFARAFHVGRQVLIESDIWADDINPANLGFACSHVAQATDSMASKLKEAFGGRARFEESKTSEYRIPLGFAGSAEMAALRATATPPQ
ncbi:T3SS (YopN, CesT) and YbjN peptide-binding chaperone 1 [Aestuariimicrobium soli]|uniref:T3SS (YopN, CesT) and YbjN peptide-binding chaperone 1 n=1 Tax=Aestuariimicrobium soli TaxID=2035834 RepID=UPI003EBFE257